VYLIYLERKLVVGEEYPAPLFIMFACSASPFACAFDNSLLFWGLCVFDCRGLCYMCFVVSVISVVWSLLFVCVVVCLLCFFL
jgi:hypothetical protein